MVTYLPISSPFIRFAGRYVDEALGVAAGYNFFVFEAALVPFEIVAVSLIVRYWTNVIPVAAMNVIVLVLYGFVFLPVYLIYKLTLYVEHSIYSLSNGTAKQSSGSH
jgi:amino acid permease